METEESADKWAELRSHIPEEPGVYKYLNHEGKIIYVGKARNLRRRVNSYFTKHTGLDAKTRMLVKQIADIQYVVTPTELDALILENNLIKEHRPKYNIELRDGKTYPYICIKNERFPRVFSTRVKVKDGSTYFGPYPGGGAMHALLQFIHDNFKLRTCALNLSEANIKAGKFRPCLEFQIGRCRAPCVNSELEAVYNEEIRQVKQILKGSFKAVVERLKSEMTRAADELDFERAHELKLKIEQLLRHKQRSTVVSETLTDVEVVTVMTDEGLSVVNHFTVVNGTIVRTHAFDVRHAGEGVSEGKVLAASLDRLIAETDGFKKEILANVVPEDYELPEGFALKIPTRGDGLKIVELSLKNCRTLLDEKLNRKWSERGPRRTLERLQQDLGLPRLPAYIECFDNSNIQGYAPVSSCVVFRDGKPAKRDYRVFQVKTVEGPDDFATMKEVVFRRYRRLLEEQKPLPDLVVIDGGKGQLSHALEALEELGLSERIPIIGIAKRLEEIYKKNDPVPLYLDKKSPSLRLIQHIRNEAHAAALAFHRKKRGEKTLKTELSEIRGIGPATTQKLLTTFKSPARVKQATLDELEAAVGKAKAQIVFRHYHGDEN
ncbi:MAG: excinuclease ABC subunit UvrC [Bacteroidia bacterium]|nr:excinuclease ABC subunit UvrC [Bacteroidia bacterium]MDW8332693.1 excinuclease ABC subunit UvrC [Bacteroidia bacterium]